MTTECTRKSFGFHPLKNREIRAQFDGGAITTDGGGLLLREVEKRTGIVHQFASCFRDHRDADLMEHTVEELVAQRVYGLALGYEDLNDHEELRKDPMLAVLVGKSDPLGDVLAGKSTLNRLELTPQTATAKDRYKRIVADHAAIDRLFVDLFLAAHRQAPPEMILDLDAAIRLKPLKIGGLLRFTVRKVWVSLASGYPSVTPFAHVHKTLQAIPHMLFSPHGHPRRKCAPESRKQTGLPPQKTQKRTFLTSQPWNWIGRWTES